MTQTKIEWVRRKDGKQGYTWNPVYGCRNGCEYCYARRIATRFPERFGDFNEPKWIPENYHKPMPKTPSMIFVGSMSDIRFWHPELLNKTIQRTYENPQHRYFFLSKFSYEYGKFIFPGNCWIGATITCNSDLYILRQTGFLHKKNKKYLSIEPLHSELPLLKSVIKNIEWVIVGAETGSRKGKITPDFAWMVDIRYGTWRNTIPLFMKPSLSEIWEDELIQEFPELWNDNGKP